MLKDQLRTIGDQYTYCSHDAGKGNIDRLFLGWGCVADKCEGLMDGEG